MKISRLIYKTLNYTNGWGIDDTKYKKLCDEIENKIRNKYYLLEKK